MSSCTSVARAAAPPTRRFHASGFIRPSRLIAQARRLAPDHFPGRSGQMRRHLPDDGRRFFPQSPDLLGRPGDGGVVAELLGQRPPFG
jgi:hypothetical protein